MLGNYLRALSENVHLHSCTYEKFIILGDFSVEIWDPQIKSFCDNYN